MQAQKPGLVAYFVLELSGNRVVSMNPDGSDWKIVVTDCHHPDGIVFDAELGHIYWTNMGANPKENSGSIERADIDGQNRKTIIPEAGTFTPKQLHLDKENGKLYWSDREGMRVMRSNLDGSQIETLVDTSNGDPRPGRDAVKWCVGITVDGEGGKFYWTQKGLDNAGVGRICRANIEFPKGENATKPVRYRSTFRSLTGANRFGTRSSEPGPLLDRSGKSAERQRGKSRIN